MEEYDDEGSLLEQLIEQDEQEMLALQQMQAQQEEQRRVEERLLKNKLKLIKSNVSVSSRTFLKDSEKRTIKKAKKHKNLKSDINQINTILMLNAGKNTSKFITSSPLIFYVIIGVLLIFLIITVMSTIGSLMSWLFDDGNEDGANAVFGITGADFFGARMVYTDDNRAIQTIIQDYSQFVEDGIETAKLIETINVDGTNYNITLNIEIAVPEDEYFRSLNAENISDFETDYVNLYNIVFNNIAKPIYKIDNGSDFIIDNGTLIDCAGGIKYFGFTNITEIAPTVAENLITSSNFTATQEGGETVGDEILPKIEDEIEKKIVEHYVAETKYSIRTEKWFVKDYILTEDNEMITGVKKENYVAMIFMPRNNVTFTKMSFSIGNANLDGFKITLNGEDLQTDGNNLGTDEKQSFIYGGEVDIDAEKYIYIDEKNLTALDNISLFDIVESVDNYSTYLQQITTEGENPITYFTLWQDGVVVRTENSEAFTLIEYETSWQTAS